MDDFKQHAKSSYPFECVGCVKDDVYYPLINTHSQPDKFFSLSLAEIEKINPEYILHSHPATGKPNPEWPSITDLKLFYSQPQYKWGIIATDGEEFSNFVLFDEFNPPDLEGRTYVWGIADCYSVIRDWYWLDRSIKLKNYPRDYNSYKAGEDLYSKYFADAGFYEVGINDVQVGDVLLMAQNGVISHAAIVNRPGRVIHHYIGRFSQEDDLSKWIRATNKVVRHAQTL